VTIRATDNAGNVAVKDYSWTVNTDATSVSNASADTFSLLTNTTTNYWFGFTATKGLAIGSTVTVVFPEGFNVTGATGYPVSNKFTIQSISGQTVTYTVGTEGAVFAGRDIGYGLLANGIVNPTTPGTYMIQVSTSNDLLPVFIPVTFATTGSTIKNASIHRTSLLVNSNNMYQFDFTPTSGLPPGSTISVVFPEGFNIAGASINQNTAWSIQNISGQTITYNVGAGGGSYAGRWNYLFQILVANGIINPSSPGTYSIQIFTSNDPTPVLVPVQINATGAAVTNAGFDIYNGGSLMTNAITTIGFHFNATSGLPSDSTVTVVFPDGFNLSGVPIIQDTIFPIESITGQTITFKKTMPIIYYTGWYVRELGVDGIVNPSEPGIYSIQISTSIDPIPVFFPITISKKPTYPLSLSITGSGGGTVTNITSGTACLTGETCSVENFDEDITAVLSPLRNKDSIFAGWGGACNNTTGDCKVSMTSPKSVTASFTKAPKAMNGTAAYSSVQTAYNEAASGDVINIIEGVLAEPLTLENATDVVLDGGYSADYSVVSTDSIIRGGILIRSGSVRMRGIKVQ
jgi:hypothetical protein